jgi:anti-sigma28 factor (negative regulator of flagellin synthesis)
VSTPITDATYEAVRSFTNEEQAVDALVEMRETSRKLERENAMFRRALADALSTFQHENEVIVTAERVEAWKAALSNGNQ